MNHAAYVYAIGCLKQGTTLRQGNDRLKLTFARFLKRYPLFHNKAGFAIKELRETQAGEVRTALTVLLFTVSFVLLIACSNIASLLLARANTRQHEMAVRAALGGSRGRLVAQMLTEGGLLAAAGGVFGLVTGRLCLRLLLTLYPEAVPVASGFDAGTIDWRVLFFSATVSLAAMLLCGLLPALRASKIGAAHAMQGNHPRTGLGRSTVQAGSFLVVLEVALAVMLAAGAGLMIRTFAALRRVETGLEARRVLTLQMSLQGTKFRDTAAVTKLADDGVARLQRLPGVIAAVSTWTLPVEVAFGSSFVVETASENLYPALMRPVSSQYDRVFRIPLKRGRFLSDQDTAASASVAVVSEALAKKV